MKTPKQFAAWVEGIRRQYDLYEMCFGRAPSSAGETLSWIQQEWREFVAERGQKRYVRYCAGHRLEDTFFAWLEAKIMLKGAIKA
jgi:hypothetical protein